LIYLITGNGGGKTTQALGLAVRALGHGKKVVIIQFMKGRATGEYKFLSKHCTIKQFGAKSFVNLKSPSKKDKELAQQGLAFAKEALKTKPFLLILDEVNLACAVGLLDVKDVIDLLNKRGRTNIVLTGRYAPQELVKTADIVTEVADLTPKSKRMPAKKGLEY